VRGVTGAKRVPVRDDSLEGRVSRLETSVEGLHRENGNIAATLVGHGEALSGLRQVIDSVDGRLEQLAVLMERQVTQREALERAFSMLGKQDGRLSNVEHRLAGLESQGAVVQAAGSGIVAIVVRVIATGIVAAVATVIALYASRGVA
jgi:hypothetical protein